jgi:hypothetical protein
VTRPVIIASRAYHDTPPAIGPFETLEAARDYYDRLYEENPEHPIFWDEARFLDLVSPDAENAGATRAEDPSPNKETEL